MDVIDQIVYTFVMFVVVPTFYLTANKRFRHNLREKGFLSAMWKSLVDNKY